MCLAQGHHHASRNALPRAEGHAKQVPIEDAGRMPSANGQQRVASDWVSRNRWPAQCRQTHGRTAGGKQPKKTRPAGQGASEISTPQGREAGDKLQHRSLKLRTPHLGMLVDTPVIVLAVRVFTRQTSVTYFAGRIRRKIETIYFLMPGTRAI